MSTASIIYLIIILHLMMISKAYFIFSKYPYKEVKLTLIMSQSAQFTWWTAIRAAESVGVFSDWSMYSSWVHQLNLSPFCHTTRPHPNYKWLFLPSDLWPGYEDMESWTCTFSGSWLIVITGCSHPESPSCSLPSVFINQTTGRYW